MKMEIRISDKGQEKRVTGVAERRIEKKGEGERDQHNETELESIILLMMMVMVVSLKLIDY